LEVSHPRIEYTGALAPFQGRTWPFRSIKLLLAGRLQINDPTATEFCGLGQSAFRICVGSEGYRFSFEINDDAERRGNAQLAFIDNTVAHDVDALQRVTDAFNQVSPDAWTTGNQCAPAPAKPTRSAYFMWIENSKIQYAPPRNG